MSKYTDTILLIEKEIKRIKTGNSGYPMSKDYYIKILKEYRAAIRFLQKAGDK